MRIFGFFVDADELAVEHESLAGGDGGLALAARHAEDHVAVDVRVGERRERLIIHHDDVRRRARLEHAELVGEECRGIGSAPFEGMVGEFRGVVP